MKTLILLLAVSTLFITSCSTAYKTGQTPDDVYYSPARLQDEYYVEAETRNSERRYRYNDAYYDDRYLRMKVRNRYRWSELDDWYLYDRYSIGYNYFFGSFNNPFNIWNYYYNPYCCCLNNLNYVFINPNIPATSPLVKRHFNLAGYTGTPLNNGGMVKNKFTTTTRPIYNNTNYNINNNHKSFGDKFRAIFSNQNTGNSPSRTYSPSSSDSFGGSSSSSSSGAGSSGGGISRPVRNQ